MKCIYCGTDNNLKDRTSNHGRCSKCHHLFAFEPTQLGALKVTDPMFAKAIADLSANDALFFTPKQFLYFIDRRLRSKASISKAAWLFVYLFVTSVVTAIFGNVLFQIFQRQALIFVPTVVMTLIFISTFLNLSNSTQANQQERKAGADMLQIVGVLILVAGIAESIIINSFLLFAAAVLLGMSSFVLGIRQKRKLTNSFQTFLVNQNQFQHLLDRWQQAHNPIDKLLPPPNEQSSPVAINPDITNYSFDRLIVCDSASVAQMLISNNFHFENNCAILSITGYPQSIFATTMQMLRRNSELQIYALHDCSPKGIGLVHHLRNSPNWFQDSNAIIFDIGLLPRQIFVVKNAFVQTSFDSAQEARTLPAEVRQGLSTAELEWLESGKFVELESFTPQRLIQVLNRSISGSRDLVSDDGTFILLGDTSHSIYTSESFG